MTAYRWRGIPGWDPAALPPIQRRIWRGGAVRIRDVPASCTCRWTFRHRPARWERDKWNRGCPWHTTAVAA